MPLGCITRPAVMLMRRSERVKLPGYVIPPDLAGLTASVWLDPDDTKGLINPLSNTRFSATWSAPEQLHLVLEFADFETHQIAIYFMDWEAAGRAQTVELLDTSQTQLLDQTRLLADFSGGVYFIWDVTGQILVRINRQDGPNAVMSGIFFQY